MSRFKLIEGFEAAGNFALLDTKDVERGDVKLNDILDEHEQNISKAKTDIKSNADEITKLKTKSADYAKKSEVYTKSEVYSKAETNTELAKHPLKTEVYTKSETDTELAKKVNTQSGYGLISDAEKAQITANKAAAESLREDLTATQSDVAGKASSESVSTLQTEMAVQEARMDQLVGEVPEGSADEIADARVDETGKTWPNLGDHIRGSASRLKEHLESIERSSDEVNKKFSASSAVAGGVTYNECSLYTGVLYTITNTGENQITVRCINESGENVEIEGGLKPEKTIEFETPIDGKLRIFYSDASSFVLHSGGWHKFKERISTIENRVDAIEPYKESVETTGAGGITLDRITPKGVAYNITNNSSDRVTFRLTADDTSQVLKAVEVAAGKVGTIVADEISQKIRLWFNGAGSVEIEQVDGMLVSVVDLSNQNKLEVEKINDIIDNSIRKSFKLSAEDYKNGYFCKSDGTEERNSLYSCTDWIECNAVKYGINISIVATLGVNAAVVFADEQKQVIGYYNAEATQTGLITVKPYPKSVYVKWSVNNQKLEESINNGIAYYDSVLIDAPDKQEYAVNLNIDSEHGGIEFTTGKSVESDTRIRTQYIYAVGRHFEVSLIDESYEFMAFEYDERRTMLNDYTAAAWQTKQYRSQYDGETKYLRVAVRKANNSTFSDEDITSIIKVVYTKSNASTEIPVSDPDIFLFDGALETYRGDNKLETLYGLYDSLMNEHSDAITRQTIGNIDGKEMLYYKIVNPATKVKSIAAIRKNIVPLPKILFISSMHGNEYTSALDDFTLIKTIIEERGNPVADYIWNNCEIHIIPTSNPVGYNNSTRTNGNRVNLNRNFADGWVYVSADTDEYNASGDSPLSELESKIMHKFVMDNSDALMCINRHNTESWSSGEMVGYFGTTFESDLKVLYSMIRKFDTSVRTKFPDISTIIPSTNMVGLSDTRRFNGTLDRWYNSIGVHGILAELANASGNYAIDGNETRKISISLLMNAINYYLHNSDLVMSNDKFIKE